MAYESGAIEAALCAAIGEDDALIRELRVAFVVGARSHLASLTGARTVAEWQRSALRLKGLAASFGATKLMVSAHAATTSAVGDVRVLAVIAEGIDAID